MIKTDLTIYKGNDFISDAYEIRDALGNLCDPQTWGIAGIIRASDAPDAQIITSFSILHEEPEPGRKIFRLSLNDGQTLAVTEKIGFYDVLLSSPDGIDTTEIKGKITFGNTTTQK